jgi:hypothetical protein
MAFTSALCLLILKRVQSALPVPTRWRHLALHGFSFDGPLAMQAGANAWKTAAPKERHESLRRRAFVGIELAVAHGEL